MRLELFGPALELVVGGVPSRVRHAPADGRNKTDDHAASIRSCRFPDGHDAGCLATTRMCGDAGLVRKQGANRNRRMASMSNPASSTARVVSRDV